MPKTITIDLDIYNRLTRERRELREVLQLVSAILTTLDPLADRHDPTLIDDILTQTKEG